MSAPSGNREVDYSKRSKRADLSRLLLRDGAPWRPFDEEGVLLAAQESTRSAKDVHAACEQNLLAHLKAVCGWPERERNKSWRIGDYSFYILEFDPMPGTLVYAQIWSDPDSEDVTFEVSSGAWNPPADRYVDPARQELMRDHGFEIGGNPRSFRKKVTARSHREVIAVAREAIAVLCKALGYDGRQDLRYRLCLGSSAKPAYVLENIAPDQIVSLCKEWGLVAEPKARENGQLPLLEVRQDFGVFGILLAEPSSAGNGYQAIALRTFMKLPLSSGDEASGEDARLKSINKITQAFNALQVSLDKEGDLKIETIIYLHGGVTADHIGMRVKAWRSALTSLRAGRFQRAGDGS